MDLERATANCAREIESFGRAKEDALRKIAEHEAELVEVEEEYDQSPMDETIYLRREMIKADISRLRERVLYLDSRIANRQTQQAVAEEARRLREAAERLAALAAEDLADAKVLDKQIAALAAACVRVRERGGEIGRLARTLGVHRHTYSFGLGNIGAILATKLLTAGVEGQLHCIELTRPGTPANATAEGFAKRSAERLSAVLEGSR